MLIPIFLLGILKLTKTQFLIHLAFYNRTHHRLTENIAPISNETKKKHV